MVLLKSICQLSNVKWLFIVSDINYYNLRRVRPLRQRRPNLKSQVAVITKNKEIIRCKIGLTLQVAPFYLSFFYSKASVFTGRMSAAFDTHSEVVMKTWIVL